MSSGNGGRSWFEGTMEVISGMAPRPSTPQPYQARSMSAPNSPARHNFPGINRLPSQDSLDRSIHNESGHGKSTAQIIRDLKASNASLSAKTASMEAQFMNQLSEVTRSFEDRQRFLEESVRKKDKQLAALESMKTSAENKLKEKDAQVSKVKEESAFQRHTISDLKNQLYQLQTEMEEMEFEKRDDLERLAIDNQEMARVIEVLQRQVEEGREAKHQVEALKIELEKAKSSSSDSPVSSREEINPIATNPQEEDNHLVWKKLEKTQGELERHRQRLTVAEVSLDSLKKEKNDQAEEHIKRVEELECELQKASEHWKERESMLCEQIESLEFTDGKMTQELRNQLEERDNTIAELEDEVRKYADQAVDLTAELAQVRQDAANQEVYRRDEAEDLRILHDAQEEEIERLRKDLDEAQRELELRDQELDESERELRKLIDLEKQTKQTDDEILKLRKELEKKEALDEEIASLKRKLDEKEKQLADRDQMIRRSESTDRDLPVSEDPDHVRVLEEDLFEARESTKKLEQKILDSSKSHKEEIAALEASLKSQKEQKDEVANQLAALQKEHRNVHAKLEKSSSDADKIKDLENEIKTLKKTLSEKTEAEKVALEKVRELQTVAMEVDGLRSAKATDEQEMKRLNARLLDAEKEAAQSKANVLLESKKEIKRLQQTIEVMESSGSNANALKKQLREAQIALVALDDEKKQMAAKHRELLAAVEKKKEEMQRNFKKELDAKEREVAELRKLEDTARRAEELESKTVDLEEKIKRLESEIDAQKRAGEGEVKKRVEQSNQEINDLQKKLESVKSEHETQMASMKAKLKDRDTTISALVRSSVSMEEKVSSTAEELAEAREKRRQADMELAELRKSIAKTEKSEKKISAELAAMQKELQNSKADIERWQRALENDGSTSASYRYQITLLQKEADENAEKLLERDSAIENLVNQSMSQESLVQDLKSKIATLSKEVELARSQKNRSDDAVVKAELRRLQQESSIFAGQIIEQDEELESLKRTIESRDDQVLSLKKEISELKSREDRDDVSQKMNTSELRIRDEQVGALKDEVSQLQSELKVSAQLVSALQSQITKLQMEGSGSSEDSKRLKQVEAELDEMRDANESYRSELRDLRRDLYAAKEASGKADDLEKELAQAKYTLEEYKRKSDVSAEAAKREVQTKMRELLEEEKRKLQESDIADRTGLREELEEALTANKALEEKTTQQLEHLRRLKNDAVEALETKLRERDETIERLKRASSNLDDEQIVIFQREIEQLRKELAEKSQSFEQLEQEFEKKSESLKKMERVIAEAPGDEIELREELSMKSKSLEETQQELARKARELGLAEITVRNLKEALDSAETSKKDLEKELNETMYTISTSNPDDEVTQANQDLVKINDGLLKANKTLAEANENLAKEVATLKANLATINKDLDDTEALKAQLNQEKETRENTEKSIVESYERQLSLLNLNKDVTIDNLRKDLAESRGKSSEDMSEILNAMRHLEDENAGLREQLEVELQDKNQQIYALEHTLHAQEQLVENMRMEMDQLQSGMEHATERRRGEVEEMQQEVIEIEARANKQEREIIALKMQLEESKLEHKAEVVRLRDTIVALENESPLAKTVAELQNDDRMLEVRERLEQLKWRNTSLQEENLKLGGRLERAVIEIKALEAEKIHANEMEREVARLSRQVKTLEDILSRPPSQNVATGSVSPSKTTVDKENKKEKKAKKSLNLVPRKSPSGSGNFNFFKRRGKDSSDDSSQQDARSSAGSARDDR